MMVSRLSKQGGQRYGNFGFTGLMGWLRSGGGGVVILSDPDVIRITCVYQPTIRVMARFNG